MDRDANERQGIERGVSRYETAARVASVMQDREADRDRDDERRRIHDQLRAIRARREEDYRREADLLIAAEEVKIWRLFGFASLLEYMEVTLDLGPRAARERLRVAKAMLDLPVIHAELATRAISYSTARLLTRVATRETEEAWLEQAREIGPRELDALVAQHKVGDRPTDPVDPDRLIKLTLEVRASTAAAFRVAGIALGDERGEVLEEDEILGTLCRLASEGGGPHGDVRNEEAERSMAVSASDELALQAAATTTAPAARPDSSVPSPCSVPRPAYPTAITTCRTCRTSYQDGGGAVVAIPPSLLELALCDAEHLGDLEAETPMRLIASVTPRLRRQVFARDHHRCTVPGCRAARNLDIHHVTPRSHGGQHSMVNLILLCSGHHQRHHEGRLRISGTAPHQLVFEAVEPRPRWEVINADHEASIERSC